MNLAAILLQVGKEMFVFADSDEQLLTLRPENTASMWRASLAQGCMPCSNSTGLRNLSNRRAVNIRRRPGVH
jgi:hypothetical protein